MVMSESKQLKQVLNIMDTLLEAAEHLSGLVKERELNQSIFMFSSIVEGFGAIDSVLTPTQTKSAEKERKEIEQLLLLIAQQMEQGNLLKVAEILQFSLIPKFRNLKRTFEGDIQNEISDLNLTIGVYLSHENPRDVYTEARINALVEESERQNTEIFFFSSEGVDIDNKQVKADMFINGTWQEVTKAFPSVIHNIGVASRFQQSVIERKLRKEIPFTSFAVGNKLYLPKKMIQYRKFVDLFVPFKIAINETAAYDFLKENESAVFKPIMGRQGQNIYFVEKRGNRYHLLDHRKSQILNQNKFEDWIKNTILNKKGSYMIQRYINCRTKDNEPYDIRAHVQKDGEGKWQLTRIYPRIGHRDSILSNISRGGRTEGLGTLFTEQFGKKGKQYENDIQQLAIELTAHLDKIYGLALDELGLDLAIDQDGRFWLHEVNNGPQSTYHEEMRAVNTIAYAKYIAENGLYFTNEFQKRPYIKGQFNARNTNLPSANLSNQFRIGMLVDKSEVNNLTLACAYVAKFENKHFYYFTPKDIDYDEMLIRGYFYENKEWVPKVVSYPDVIYDRLRLRGIKGHNTVYEELEGIPFTNEFYGNSISKLEVYDQLSSTGKLNEAIIPYQKVNRVREIFHYIERYGKVIIKPEIGSFARGVHFISKLDNGEYFVAEGAKEKYYSEFALSNYLRELIQKSTFIVQKYIETRTIDGQPFDIRVHMMKDGNGEWSFVNNYPRIGIAHAVISSTRNGGYIGELLGFLKRNFAEHNGEKLMKKIESLALKVASTYEGYYENNLSELALDMAIDTGMKPYIIEVNVNKPGIIYYEFEVAKHAIPYATYLAENNQNINEYKECFND